MPVIQKIDRTNCILKKKIKKLGVSFEKHLLNILPKIVIQLFHSSLSLIYNNLQTAAEIFLKALRTA